MVKLLNAEPSFVATRAMEFIVGDEVELVRGRTPERRVVVLGVEFPARTVVWRRDCVFAVGARSGLGVGGGFVVDAAGEEVGVYATKRGCEKNQLGAQEI